ncbi:MAG: CPBP family intramembrane metalloprotease [Verrucomicrobiales bacterium]|nr:CPBP family intramembrane metalloprotease [Verrucomicrobiales bacterium]
MSESLSPPPLPEPVSPDRPAAWWSWPLILLSVFFIGWSVNLFAPRAMDAIEEKEGGIDPGELALFKIQSQVIIAAAPLSGRETADSLKEMRTYAQNDAMIMALAMLESFVAIEGIDPLETLSRLSAKVSDEGRSLAYSAVESGLDEKERGQLEEKLGWFASLAPATGNELPPNKEAIQVRAMLFMGMASLMFVAAAVGVALGVVLLVLQRREALSGKKWGRFSPDPVPRGIMLESFAIYLGIMAFGEMGGLWIHSGISYTSYLLAVVVPFLWPFARGVRWRHFARSIGLHRGEGIAREIGAGFLGYLKVMAIASIGIFLTVLLSTSVGFFTGAGETVDGAVNAVPPGPQTHPIVGWIYMGGLKERLLCLFLAAGFAPVFEEIFFRGALHRWLRGRFGFLVSALLTGAIFAALHPQGWMGLPALAAIGVGFSLLRESRDSLIAPMTAHAINNGVLVGMLCLAL